MEHVSWVYVFLALATVSLPIAYGIGRHQANNDWRKRIKRMQQAGLSLQEQGDAIAKEKNGKVNDAFQAASTKRAELMKYQENFERAQSEFEQFIGDLKAFGLQAPKYKHSRV